jgi:hypothetical protein
VIGKAERSDMNLLICTGPLWIRDTLYRTRLKTFDREMRRPGHRQWAARTPAIIVTGAT